MANILCAWELGGGLGHLSNLKPFVDAARVRGHEVTLVAKELQNITSVFPDYPFRTLQAPYLHRSPQQQVPHIRSFPQLLLRRFETDQELETLCRAWDTLFEATRPDVVIYEFAPTAMIASLRKPWEKWVSGNGFFVPRTDLPFFGQFPGVVPTPQQAPSLRLAEDTLLARINAVLERRGLTGIDEARMMMTQADHQLLLTLPQLDPCGTRPDIEYLGINGEFRGMEPDWPPSKGPRIFGYLANFPAMTPLLGALNVQDASVLIYCRDIAPSLRNKFPGIRFVDEPVDLGRVSKEANLVINMGGHTTCAQFFMAGVPQLMITREQEQHFHAARIVESGMGIRIPSVTRNAPRALKEALALVNSGKRGILYTPAKQAQMSGQLIQSRIAELMAQLTPA